jgi:hypothetical protein
LKTIRFFLVVIVAFMSILPIFAQEPAKAEAVDIKPENSSAYYYINVPIEKVYPHQLGYMIAYRKSGAELGHAYLPGKWFAKSAGKGELIRLEGGSQWPYLSVYYKDGKVDHLRLFVRSEYSHQSWGHIPSTANIDDRFNVEDLKLDF